MVGLATDAGATRLCELATDLGRRMIFSIELRSGDSMGAGGPEEDELKALEYMDAIFPESDYRVFASAGGAGRRSIDRGGSLQALKGSRC